MRENDVLSPHSNPRILLYGHDTFGLGHLRRNLTLAHALAHAWPDASLLLLTGSSMAGQFAMPAHLDYIKLPSVVKVADEDYHAQLLHLSPHELVRLRSALVREAIRGFAPDLVLIDHAPIGMKGELLPALADLRQQMPHTRVVLGLRDIIDAPEHVRATWATQRITSTIEAFYDAILVYGLPEMLDVATAYALPASVAHMLHYCGYLQRTPASADATELRSPYCAPGERLVVVTAGGGGDGYALLHTLVRAAQQHVLAPNVVCLIVTGPFLPTDQREALQQAAADVPKVHLIEFTGDLIDLMSAADALVCMGGYNTVCEALSVGTPTIVVPRVMPRQEQWLRATAFADLGLIRLVHPSDLTPQAIGAQIQMLLDDPVCHQEMAQAREAFIARGALRGIERTLATIHSLLAITAREQEIA